MKIDNFIIETFDKGTTYLQKRGILPLNTLIMGTGCLFWSLLIVGSTGWSLYAVSAIGALALYGEFNTWSDAANYWENQRKTQELNARVLLNRESGYLFRLFSLFLFIPLGLFELSALVIAAAITSILVIIMGYLRCCRYLGPGDYARQRKASLKALPQGG